MLNSHRLSLTKIHLKVCFPLNYHYMGMVGFSKMLWHSHRKNKYFPLYRANFLGKDFPGGSDGKEFTCQCRRYWRLGFDPWVRKISWRRKWQPPPVFLPGKSYGQRRLVGYRPHVTRVRNDLATKPQNQ